MHAPLSAMLEMLELQSGKAVLSIIWSQCSSLHSFECHQLATLEWVDWFNRHRLLEPIGYIPPAEAEAQYYRQLANMDSACVT